MLSIMAAALLLCAALVAPVRGAQPNILFVLADDLDSDYKQDRLAIMPNLRKLREAGVHFINHVVSNQ